MRSRVGTSFVSIAFLFLFVVAPLEDWAQATKAKSKTGKQAAVQAGLACKLEGHEGAVNAVAFSPDGKQVLSGGFDHSLRIWDVHKAKLISNITDATGHISGVVSWQTGKGRTAVQFSAVSTDHGNDQISVLNLTTQTPLPKLSGYGHGVNSIRVAASGLLFAASGDGCIHAWNLSTGRHVQQIEIQELGGAWAVSEDGKWLVCQSQGDYVRGYDVASKKVLFKSPPLANGTVSLLLSKDAKQALAFSSDQKLRTLSTKDGTIAKETELPGPPVSCSAFSSDGKLLLLGHNSGAVTLLDASTLKSKAEFFEHKEPVLCVAFSADSKSAVSSSKEGLIAVWNLPD